MKMSSVAGNSNTAIHVHVNVRSYFSDYFILSECDFDLLLEGEYLRIISVLSLKLFLHVTTNN